MAASGLLSVKSLGAQEQDAKKTRLIVCDCLKACCQGGPAGRNEKWIWEPECILLSTDPVALDAVGFSIIDERRKQLGLEAIAATRRNPKWLPLAAEYGLGVADLTKIEWVKAEL